MKHRATHKLMNSPTGDSPTRAAAVIVAAGSSRRMGEVTGGSKLLIPLGGETVLARTLRAFEETPRIDEIVLDALLDLCGLCIQRLEPVRVAVDPLHLRDDQAAWLVPQAFGGGEQYPREPTPGELRAMTYLGWIGGATGLLYFKHDDA